MVKADGGEKKSCEKNENNDMMNDHTTFSRSKITGVTYSNGIHPLTPVLRGWVLLDGCRS